MYWAREVEIETKIASAWAAQAEGRSADALKVMREATALEAKSETHDTLSPGPIGFTAHEALGELLLMQGQPREALDAFEELLKLAANRPRGYYGAAIAAARASDSEKAKLYTTKLAQVCGVEQAGQLNASSSGLPCAAIPR